MRRAATICVVLLAAVAGVAGGRTGNPSTVGPPAWADEVTAVGARPAAAAPKTATRAATWCGTTSTTDRPPDVTGYQVHVYYAIPADGADQSATFAPQIQDIIDQIDGWWQREDPSRLPRFDTYAAPCGPQVDLQVVRLPSVSVAMTDPHQVFDLIWTQFQSQPDAATTKFLVFVDDVNTQNICGVGGPSSVSGLGTPSYGVATVLLSSCDGADRATIAAHELLHAVSPGSGFVGAPHICSGDAYHVCDSSGDVLYPFVESGIPLNSLQLDVGHDDYWAGTAPVNLQVQPWFKHTQDQVHLGLTIAGKGEVQSDLPGLDCSASCGTDWDRGDAVSLSPASAAGYRFVRWTGGCTGDADCSLTLDASKDVTALFAPSTFPLGVRVAGSGTVTSSPRGLTCRKGACTKPFTSYEAVVLTAKAAKGWRFSAWSGLCRGSKATCKVPMTAPSAVRATFKKR
ncbi:MAG: InlB B-repeat-containing protein [Gaiellaceae bacterium]